ncbi:MAG: hypothetical protein JXR49_18815 [Acidobacteria bacterium]|nr:hypothetical protein [Acidobacteriota bacterium]
MDMNRAHMRIQPEAASQAMGLNDNLNFLGKELHVQTENVQSSAPCILTQVFYHGRVIHTAKCEYSTETRDSRDLVKIRDLMVKQHMKVIERIGEQEAKHQKRS